ncbi:HEAT repeat domain-containing protein [Maritalea mediterranea]|uniref:HEAT repeat domain-containing protein n=1 Tax=Maritalea mediterranea TaxID=2909667 RepID=A0ABS9E758_9HYPH|nr:HEAT repeat domain-containing protein [Maritalea mediterranea]MCF4097263.1 HEAT repeat domain-containing protein [Maritalea mediterranea]
MRESILTAIWSLSALLAIGAMLILIFLVVRRGLMPKVDQRFGEQRRQLEQLLVLAVNSPIDLSDALKPDISHRDHGMVLAAALDMVRSVSGAETEKMAKIAERWIGRADLLAMLQNGGRGRKIQILTLMAHLDDAQSKDCLFEHLTHADPYVQLAALRGLARRVHGEELERVFNHLHAIARTNAAFMADVLTQFGTRSVPYLLELLPKQGDENWLAAVLMALGNVGDLQLGRMIAGYANHSSPQVRRAVAIALGELQDGQAIDSLLMLAQDAFTSVRLPAITSLGLVQVDRAYATLLETLDDPEWWVRFHAAQTLVKTGARGRALLQAYINTNGPNAHMAQLVMQEQGELQSA